MPVDVDFLASAFGSAQKVAGPPVVPSAEPETDFLAKAFASAPPSKRLSLEQEKSRLQSEARGLDLVNRFNPANLFKGPEVEKTIEGGILPQAWLGLKSGFATVGQGANKLLELAARSGGINPIQSELLAPGSGRQTVEQFRGASEIAGQWAREAEQLGQKTKGPDLVRHVTGGLVTMLPAMSAAPLGLPAAVVAVGLQSFGSTFANAEEAYKAKGLSDQDARQKALWPALATGVGTALITRGFGATGIENWTKAISSGSFRQTFKEVAKAAGFEASEEFYDQVQQRLWAELSYQPSADFTQALERTLEEASLAGLSGGLAAGGLRTVTAVSGRRESAEPGAVPPIVDVKTPEEQTIARMRAGLFPVRSGERTPEERQALLRAEQERGQQELERVFAATLGRSPARRSAAAFAEAQGIPVGAEPAKPAPTVSPVEEIEPFGTVRQFRVTREFYNPADEGTYKVGDIIPEPQLTKAGVAVPEPKAPVAPKGIRPQLVTQTKELTDFLKSKGVEVDSFLSNPYDHITYVGEQYDGSYEIRVEHHSEGALTTELVNVKAGESLSNPGKLKFIDGVGTRVFRPDGTISNPMEKGAPSALEIQSPAKIPVQPTAEGSETVVKEVRPPIQEPPGTRPVVAPEVKAEAAAPEVVPPVAPAKPPGERITLANNKTVELPEFTLEMIRRGSEEAHTGLTRPASVLFSPREKGFLLIKGAGQRAAYRIPLSEIPHEITKGGISFDKQAVLDFLNDKARRQAAMVDDRNVVHYASEDIDVIQKPTGRPATGAGAPLGQVTMDPKTLEAIAPAAPGRRPIGRAAMEVLGQLERSNPRLAEILERRRPEELDAPFWASIRDEFLRMADRPEYAQPLSGEALALYRRQTPAVEQVANPTNADGLTASIRSLKERGDITGAQAAISPKGWEGITGEPARAAQEAANLKEARLLVDDPNNGLSAEARAVLRDILDSPVAAYLNGRQIRFRLVDRLPGTQEAGGLYSFAQQLIVITRGTDPSIGAHEFFHPLWEMIQDTDRRKVKAWRDSALAETIIKAEQEGMSRDVLGGLYTMRERELSFEEFEDFGIDHQFYHLSSTEEFFAWMMTERFGKDRLGIWGQASEIWASQDAFLSKVRQILAAIFDAIRQRVPGLRTQADILQRTILDGKYDVLPPSENIPGKKLVTKNAVITAPGVGPAAAITAYHGTGAKVETLSLEKAGEGSGGMAFGWGIYGAENIEVAKSYMPTRTGGNLYTVRLDVEMTDLLDWDKPLNQQSSKVQQALEPLIEREISIQEMTGRGGNSFGMTPREYLLGRTGREIYKLAGKAMSRTLNNSPEGSSKYLLSLGIPGIKYLDQGSRGTRATVSQTLDGKFQISGVDDFKVFGSRDEAQRYVDKWNADHPPTSNFVIFDESKIHITHENGQEVPLREAMGKERGVQAALESRKQVEKYVEPLEPDSPAKFHAMASVLNKGLVPPSVVARYTALPEGVRGEFGEMFSGRIGTHAEGPTLQEVLADPNRTPEQKSEHAFHAFSEWIGYQSEKLKVHDKSAAVSADLEKTITDRMEATPETNEAQAERAIRIGAVIDRIQSERVKTGEAAQANALISEGIEHIEALNDLMRAPAAHSRALTGIARLVGRAELTAERPGENVLDLISVRGNFLERPTTPREWVQQLATHLDQMRTPEDRRVVNASRDVIEGTLWGLRQMGDFRQHLLEVQMTEDGTLRRFNADYLADLRSKTPRGFDTILKEYAKAQVEADALRNIARRLDQKITNLTERKENLEAAVQFLNEHDANQEFKAFGETMTRATGAIKDVKVKADGAVVTYEHPLTGADVIADYSLGMHEGLLLTLKGLADAGLEYAARPDAEAVKKAGWERFADHIDNVILALHSDNARLADMSWFNPLKLFNFITKSRYGLISKTTYSRIPGVISLLVKQARDGYSGALKTNNALQKKFNETLRNTNLRAMRSHGMQTLDLWRDEIASYIHDSRQHTGQTLYNVGDSIPGFGHIITKEDMAAIRQQYEFEQHLVRLAKRANLRELQRSPAMIKEHDLRTFRFAQSTGPGTVTRYLPQTTRDLPALWKTTLANAAKAPLVDNATDPSFVNKFLASGDRYKRVVLGHVLENERPYFLLGKGKFAEDYKRIRNEQDVLIKEGRMPASLDDLSQFIADRYNQRTANADPPVPPATPGEVRRTLIQEVTRFMDRVGDDNAKKETASNVDIILHENEFTQPRGEKIAPGSLYRYGTSDPVDAFRKGAHALEFYVIKYRDSLRVLNNALIAEKAKLKTTLEEAYGGIGWTSRRKLNAAIVSGNESVQRHQMTVWEVNRDIARIGRMLNNVTDIAKRGEGFFGDDIASRMFMPWWNFAVSNVLLAPMTLITNGVSGEMLWALKTAEIRKGGWLWVPGHVIKDYLKTVIRTVALAEMKVPFSERRLRPGVQVMKLGAIKRLLDNPMLHEGAAEVVTGIAQDAADREQMDRLGMMDRFNWSESVGTNKDWTFVARFKAALESFRDVHADPSLSASKEFFGYIGMFPRAFQVATRHGLMRAVDNWINVKSQVKADSLASALEVNAIQAFDSRLEHDPEFQRIYREYGDNYKRFSIEMASGKGELLSPTELTGKYDPLTKDKAAVQLRETFFGNNDAVDLIMLKYWWNKRHANGDRTAPIMTPAQRYSLMFALAEDTNMGTPGSRPMYWMGSKERQMAGVLGQWFLWNTDKLQELFAKVRGQKAGDVRYLAFVFGFLVAAGLAGLAARIPGQRANDALFNTISSQPDFLDAENDDERWKILLSVAANFWGLAGSIFKGFNDTPGKLGIRNPIFGANYVTDLLQTMAKMYQSKDVSGPALDFLARYMPVARTIINRAPGREGLVEVRNAANALRAATPETLEAKRRQPSSGNDMRATPMTPLYNTILNAAAVGDWATADEVWAKAVEQSRASGNPNPEQAILSAIRTRAPESAVFSRVLTDGERDMVYGRLTPEGRERVDRVNSAFDAIASRYGTGGATARSFGGGSRFGALPRGSSGALADIGGFGGGSRSRLSLGSPRGVRSGFRSRSLRRGLRTRRLRGLRRLRLRSRLRRLAV